MSSFVLFLHLFRINDLIKKNLSLSISEESGWVSIMAAGSCLFNLVKGRVGITIGSDLDDTSEVAAFFPGLAYLFFCSGCSECAYPVLCVCLTDSASVHVDFSTSRDFPPCTITGLRPY